MCWGRHWTPSSVSTPPSSITSTGTSPRTCRRSEAAVALVEAARREIERASSASSGCCCSFFRRSPAYVDTKDRSGGGPELRDQIALVQQRLMMVERELGRGIARNAVRHAHRRRSRTGGSAAPELFTDLGSVVYLGFEDRFRGTTGRYPRTARTPTCRSSRRRPTCSTSAAAAANCWSCSASAA